jgi:type VI secretion system protein ImpC
MSDELRFSFDFGKAGPDRKPTPGQPLRILYLTDLGAGTRSRTDLSLESRPIKPLDIDSFEALLASEQPVARLHSGDTSESSVEISIRDIDDFHPDRIYRNLPVFQDLKDLRRRLRSPASFEDAAKDLRARLQVTPDDRPSEPVSQNESDNETLKRLFGKLAETNQPEATAEPGSYLTNLIRDVVASHVVAAADPRGDQYVAAVDDAACTQMRAILHDPEFRSLEAAWRGLDFLASHVETDVDLQIFVLNASKTELADALGPDSEPAEHSLLYRRLVQEREGQPFSLIAGDMAFGAEPQDMALLGGLGELSAHSGALFVASVAPETIGARAWDAVAEDPGSIEEPSETWTSLRSSAAAQRIALIAPGFLLRSPYGTRLDPIDAFEFEELERPGEEQGSYLWGAPALVAITLIAQSFREGEWDLRLNANLEIDDLPLVSFEAEGLQQMKPCAETLFPERVAAAILESGPIPLLAIRNRNAVRLAVFQSISNRKDRSLATLGPFVA